MGKLLIKEKDVVVPGQIVAEGMEYLPSRGMYRTGDLIIADRLGIISVDGKVLKSIPLSGVYKPKRNDVIIGRVEEVTMNGWRLDINSAYTAFLSTREGTFEFVPKHLDLSRIYDIGDYLVVKITSVNQGYIDVSAKFPGFRKLRGGQFVEVNTHKVPRIIGKKGSMVSIVKEATECRVIVGQNGLIWIYGSPRQELYAVDAIKKIERESHVPGLTDRVKIYIAEKTGYVFPKEEEVKDEENNDEDAYVNDDNEMIDKSKENKKSKSKKSNKKNDDEDFNEEEDF